MSDSVWLHRWQPTRLPRPWDSPGKNTRVGCHFLLQCMKVKVKSLSRVQPLATPWTAAYQAPPSMGFSRQEYWSGVRGTPKRLEQAGSLLPTPPHGAMHEGVEVTVLRDQVGRAGEKETNVSHFICLILLLFGWPLLHHFCASSLL